jgi:ubiquinone/menaquinone biosynthesis C-methylase UbiE
LELTLLKQVLTDLEINGLGANWQSQLNQRKKEELEFHNRDRDKAFVQSLPQDTYEMLHGNKKYYSTTRLSKEYVDNWVREYAKDKVFLDYACGNGRNAILAAQSGAALSIGLDISDVSVANARQDAKAVGVGECCRFVQGDCERTGLPDNCIDTIICSGMLHHLDLSYAFPELRRILKPGGRILAVEALDYNPLIKLYRMMTPTMRTRWEAKHILSLKDLTFAKRFFAIGEVRYFHIFSIVAAFAHRRPILMNMILNFLNLLDQALTRLPFVQLMSWQFTFELIKKNE